MLPLLSLPLWSRAREGMLPPLCPSHPTKEPEAQTSQSTGSQAPTAGHTPGGSPATQVCSASPGAGWELRRSGVLGAYTAPSRPRSPATVETPRHLISLPFLPIWGNALKSTIKLKVISADKSIKILFATPTDKPSPVRGLASCLNIWLILSRTHNTRVLKSTHLREK